jgi:hypothetical protein
MCGPTPAIKRTKPQTARSRRSSPTALAGRTQKGGHLSMRDEFAVGIKETLAKRVGYRCSNPACRQLTSGPALETSGVINVGVAAHITGAAAGGPRYDAALSNEARRSADNGIWLCQKCAKLIDSDIVRYSPQILRMWRQLAEQVALAELESRPGAVSTSGGAVEVEVGNPPRPWVLIDRYFSENVELEESDQWYLLEKLKIVNRGNATAVNIAIPEIHFGGRWARVLIPLATLGPGESIDVEISNLRQTLDRVHAKVRESGLQARKGGPWSLCLRWVVEYRDLSHKRWTTEHTLLYNIFGVTFAIIHPNEPQQWDRLINSGEAV